MNQSEFIEKLENGRADWVAFIKSIPVEKMEEPFSAEGWSVKDVIAHVTWFEREMVSLIEARALVASDLWLLSIDEQNQAIFEENKERPLADILTESEQVGRQLLALAPSLTGEELNDPTKFKDMSPDWIPWQIIAGNSFSHYPDHIADIQAWLGS